MVTGTRGDVGGEGPQRLPEGAEGVSKSGARGCRVPRQRFCSSIERPGIRRRKKRENGKRERAAKKGVRTSDDFFGKREKINEKKKKEQ